MSENLIVLFVLPIILMILIIGWLVYLTRGSRPVKFNLKGFGIEIVVDAATPANLEKGDEP